MGAVGRSRIGATLALLVILAGPPAVLGALWGEPTWDRVSILLSAEMWRGATEEALIGVMAVLCWTAWAYVAMCALIEVVTLRRGGASGSGSSLRRGLRPLLAAVVVKSALAGGALAVVGSSEALADPDAGAAAVQEADGVSEEEAAVGPLGAYEVVRGDTLWGISERFLSDGLRWREVYELSKDGVQTYQGKMTDPNLIFPGDIVLLPSDAVGVVEPPSFEAIVVAYGAEVAAWTVAAEAQLYEELIVGSEILDVSAGFEPEREPESVFVSEPEPEPVFVSEPEPGRVFEPEPVFEPESEPERVFVSEPVSEAVVLVAGEDAQGDEVVERSMSMGDITKVALGSVSLLTVGGMALTMVLRRRQIAAERGLGEIPEPLREEMAYIEREVLERAEELVPWGEWLAMAVGDLAWRRPVGAGRVEFVEGSKDGVEVLLTETTAVDWGPWQSVHGSGRSVLSLERSAGGLVDGVDGWEALPLLLSVGERLCLNFETAGVVSAVAGQDGAGGDEAMRGLCRAIVMEVTCRAAECEVDLWVSEGAAMRLGQCVQSAAVKVMAAASIDEEVSELWRDAGSQRSQAMLDMHMSVDDDRKAGEAVGSCLVVCESSETAALREALRLASRGCHNLAVLVMGASDAETRLEVSVPAGEMVVHPWGIRVAACYSSDPTAAAMTEATRQPVRMVQRERSGAMPARPQRQPGEGVGRTAVRPIDASAGLGLAQGSFSEVGPRVELDQMGRAERFSAEDAEGMRRRRAVGADGGEGAHEQPRRGAWGGGGSVRGDERVTTLNLDEQGAAKADVVNVEAPEAVIEDSVPDEGALVERIEKDGSATGWTWSQGGNAGLLGLVQEDGRSTASPAAPAGEQRDVGGWGSQKASHEQAREAANRQGAAAAAEPGDARAAEGGGQRGREPAVALDDGATPALGEAAVGGGVDAAPGGSVVVGPESSETGDTVSERAGGAGGGGGGAGAAAVRAEAPASDAALLKAGMGRRPAGLAAATGRRRGQGGGAEAGGGGAGGDPDGDGGEESCAWDGAAQTPARAAGLSERAARVLGRQKAAWTPLKRLSPHALDVLRQCGEDVRWAVLTVGPLRLVSTAGPSAGCAVDTINEAVSLAALLASSGSLSCEAAQARMRLGKNSESFDQVLAALKECLGEDFVDDGAALRLRGVAVDLAFFERNFEPRDFGAGMEMLRGEVFEGESGGAVVWTYDSLVEQARFVISDWCSTHGERLVRQGQTRTAREVVTLGLSSQPIDQTLLELDMECALSSAAARPLTSGSRCTRTPATATTRRLRWRGRGRSVQRSSALEGAGAKRGWANTTRTSSRHAWPALEGWF